MDKQRKIYIKACYFDNTLNTQTNTLSGHKPILKRAFNYNIRSCVFDRSVTFFEKK